MNEPRRSCINHRGLTLLTIAAVFTFLPTFVLAQGETVEVTGSAVTIGRGKALVARSITKNGKTLVLHDVQGFRAWSGRGRNN